MRTDRLTLDSRWGVPLQHAVFRQDGPPATAAVLFPGRSYGCEAPLLYYSLQVCLERGCDVLALEYGHQAARTDLGPGELTHLVEESAAAVEWFLDRTPAPRRLLFISKSLGTVVAGEVARRFGPDRVAHLFLTPVAAAVPAMLHACGTAVSGTADTLFGPDELRALRANPELTVRRLEGADHSLLVPDDHRASLGALAQVCAWCAELLSADTAHPS